MIVVKPASLDHLDLLTDYNLNLVRVVVVLYFGSNCSFSFKALETEHLSLDRETVRLGVMHLLQTPALG